MNSIIDPKIIAEKGEKIYKEKFKEKFESECLGKFVAIDIKTEKPYIGDSPEEALNKARQASPEGLFHLIRVGFPGAFRVGYTSNATPDWIF